MPFYSNYRHWNKLENHIVDAPLPSKFVHQLIHTLPIFVLLAITPIFVTISIILSIILHYTVGPVKSSWTILTTILHSTLKSLFTMNPPQGRHSFWLIKYFSTLKLPNWLFSEQYYEKEIVVKESLILHDKVCQALGIDQSKLKYVGNNTSGSRILKGEWIKVTDADSVILYLHGGAHYFLTPSSHRTITTRISKMANASVFVPEYRLAPEHPFPFAIEDALAAYLALTNCDSSYKTSFKNEMDSVPSTKIFLMGDSSGGCLALQLAQVIRGLNLPAPAGIILMSPFVDHSIGSHSWSANFHSDFLSLDLLGTKWAMDVYANGIPFTNSGISPIHAKLTDFPPILLQCGDSEVVTEDSLGLYKNGYKQTRIDLEIYQDMFHVFQAFPFVEQSTFALERATKFISELLVETDNVSIDSGETAVETFASSVTMVNANNQRTTVTNEHNKLL